MEPTDRVDLAHAASFALGRLVVLPSVRQLRRDDGAEEVVQHRVMQVLIALARAEGGIVTRDELTMSCWEGRVVGEDAINRILSRLRAVASGIGAGSFRIETVTRVGYRLVETGADGDVASAEPDRATGRAGPTRRHLIAGVGAAGLAAIGAAAWWTWPRAPSEALPPSDVAPLMSQALTALRQDTREGQNQAIGLYRRVVAVAPGYADGWGGLANAYAATAAFRPTAESLTLRDRARSAARRALSLDPDNGFAQVALATAQPAIGNWLVTEQALRRAIVQHPRNEQLLLALATTLAAVGRLAETLPLVNRITALVPSTPDLSFFHLRVLAYANRLEEADRLMADVAAVYPTHTAIWFTRFYLLLYSGRAGEAIALAEIRDQRPTGIPEAEFDSILRVAHAAQTRDPSQIRPVIDQQLALAHAGSGYAENAIQVAAFLGHVDEAFLIADAYYFGEGFVVPELRFTPEQGTYSPMHDRLTIFLFGPAAQAMRADSRFDRLVGRLGLTRYWAESGSTPDYRRS